MNGETMNGTKDGWTISSKKHNLILLSSVGIFVSMIDRQMYFFGMGITQHALPLGVDSCWIDEQS